MTILQRYAPLTDLTVRATGSGRTIDAYAAVFDTPQEIRDREGHYNEIIDRASFDRHLASTLRVQVLFNHGMSRFGTPSDRYTMPYGRAVDVRADGNGLRTTTEVSRTPLGDEILELAKDGALTGQSFSGVVARTEVVPAAKRGGLATRVRHEISLSEYGLTPFPAYVGAEVVAIRSAHDMLELDAAELIEHLADLAPEVRAEVARTLAAMDADAGVGAGPSCHGRREHALRVLSLHC